MQHKGYKVIQFVLYLISIGLFVMGLLKPIMKSKALMGLRKDDIYITESIDYFFKEGEWFLGVLILTFTLIFPVLKYLIVGTRMLKPSAFTNQLLHAVIDIINKWAMLDVFVVAIIIVNFKMESLIIKTTVATGTYYFATSVLLLSVVAYWMNKSTQN